jgi:predicted TIM-barrel fold metal-dependent hydrolase
MQNGKRIIDTDGHVVETEHTYDFMEPGDEKYRPYIATEKNAKGSPREQWVIDGRMVRGVRSTLAQRAQEKLYESTGRMVTTPDGAVDGEDIPARLRHMDELGIDIQVLHSTMFITATCVQPETDVAVAKGYNRWLANIWNQSDGRLRYSAQLPYLAIDEAVQELRWAAQNGACAAAIRPIEGDRLCGEGYFYPVFQEAERLGLPMSMHLGNGNPESHALFSRGKSGSPFSFRIPTFSAFHWLVWSEVQDVFPTLKWGIFEAGADWIPFVIKDLKRRFPTQHATHKSLPDDLMKEKRIYVACEAGDDLAYVLQYSGEDNLVCGTDYGHTDQASELDALRELGNRTGVSQAVVDKILCDNPVALFGF